MVNLNLNNMYTREEVHKLMCEAFIQGSKKVDAVEPDVECAWILTRYDSTPENKKGKTYTEEDIVKAIMHGAKAGIVTGKQHQLS